MSDVIDDLKSLNSNPTIERAISEIEMLRRSVFAHEPSEFVPDGLTWKQLYAYREKEKQGGEPIDSYLKTLQATSNLLMAHHRQAINAMAQVMQDKEMPYIEDVWKEAMKAFMTLPKKIMEGNK